MIAKGEPGELTTQRASARCVLGLSFNLLSRPQEIEHSCQCQPNQIVPRLGSRDRVGDCPATKQPWRVPGLATASQLSRHRWSRTGSGLPRKRPLSRGRNLLHPRSAFFSHVRSDFFDYLLQFRFAGVSQLPDCRSASRSKVLRSRKQRSWRSRIPTSRKLNGTESIRS